MALQDLLDARKLVVWRMDAVAKRAWEWAFLLRVKIRIDGMINLYFSGE